jgi:hypothetical protein
MSPTVFRQDGFRVYFFSEIETRIHVHVQSGNGEAKFWMEPDIELVKNYGFNRNELGKIRRILEARQDEVIQHWKHHHNR